VASPQTRAPANPVILLSAPLINHARWISGNARAQPLALSVEQAITHKLSDNFYLLPIRRD